MLLKYALLFSSCAKHEKPCTHGIENDCNHEHKRQVLLLAVTDTPSNVEMIKAGTYHSTVVKQDGSLWAAGSNSNGMLGDGSTTERENFVKVISENTKSVAIGCRHTIVLKEDNSAWATGQNDRGQLGDGTIIDRDTFVKVISGGVKDVAAGCQHSIVLKQDGVIQLTNWNPTTGVSTWENLDKIDGAKYIVSGFYHSAVLTNDNSLWTAGLNEHGQLGDGSTTAGNKYSKVISGGVKAVSAGGRQTVVLKQDGTVWATGSNEQGQLGDGTTTDRHGFVQVNAFCLYLCVLLQSIHILLIEYAHISNIVISI